MNEDEAFIRAIVDAPGDDLPRLVYADWLDDRADPRGPYVRAETKWAKPWRKRGRKSKRPIDNPRLREMACALDALWVARVSRPPIGVCCEHMTFTDCGEPLTPESINVCATRLGLTLPLAYRAFLLNQNGGVPTVPFYWPKDTRSSEPRSVRVERFLAASALPRKGRTDTGDSSRDLEEASKVLNNGYVTGATDRAARDAWEAGTRLYVPVAIPVGLGVVALGLLGKRAGKVYEINRTVLVGSSAPRLIAQSLAEFLALFSLSITYTPRP